MSVVTYQLPPGAKLNLGCGPVQPKGWVNIDGSNRAWLANRLPVLDWLMVAAGILRPTEFGTHIKVCELRQSLPYDTNSVACIYAGEVWEHFEYADAVRVTKECTRILAPGGVLRICVPDGIEFWTRYLEIFNEIMSRPRPDRCADPLRKHIHMYFREICTKKTLLGSMGHTHKWQFDEVQLIDLFEAAGLVDVERMFLHESRIPDISAVERSDFLIVEGIKPLTQ